MTNKEFITELSTVSSLSPKSCQLLTNALVTEITNELENGNIVFVDNFGTFDVKKKNERVIINPSNGQRMLVPPKLVVNFKASNMLKERMQKGGNE